MSNMLTSAKDKILPDFILVCLYNLLIKSKTSRLILKRENIACEKSSELAEAQQYKLSFCEIFSD